MKTPTVIKRTIGDALKLLFDCVLLPIPKKRIDYMNKRHYYLMKQVQDEVENSHDVKVKRIEFIPDTETLIITVE